MSDFATLKGNIVKFEKRDASYLTFEIKERGANQTYKSILFHLYSGEPINIDIETEFGKMLLNEVFLTSASKIDGNIHLTFSMVEEKFFVG